MKINNNTFTGSQTLKSQSLKKTETEELPRDSVSSKVSDDIGLQQKTLKDMKESNDISRLKGFAKGAATGFASGLLLDFISVGFPILSPILLGYVGGGGTGALIGAAVLPVGMALAEGLMCLIKPEKTEELKVGDPLFLRTSPEGAVPTPEPNFYSKSEEEKIQFELEQAQKIKNKVSDVMKAVAAKDNQEGDLEAASGKIKLKGNHMIDGGIVVREARINQDPETKEILKGEVVTDKGETYKYKQSLLGNKEVYTYRRGKKFVGEVEVDINKKTGEVTGVYDYDNSSGINKNLFSDGYSTIDLNDAG